MAKTKSKVAAKTGTKQATGKMAKSQITHRPDIVRQEISELHGTVESGYLNLCKLLNEAYHNGYFKKDWGFDNWEAYCEAELDVHYRKAKYFVRIWDSVKEYNLDPKEVEKIGWTKMKEIISVMNKKNAKKLMQKARKTNTAQMIEECKVLRKNDQAAEGDIPKITTLTLKMGEAEAGIVLDAIGEAKKLTGSDNAVVALGLVCQDWLEAKGAQPVKATLASHLKFLERVYGFELKKGKKIEEKAEAKPEKAAKKKVKGTAKKEKKGTPSVEDLLNDAGDGGGSGGADADDLDVNAALGM
jgi:hypothetical protein